MSNKFKERKCEYCQQNLKYSKQDFENHLKYCKNGKFVKQIENQFECTFCDHRFSTFEIANKHLRAFHNVDSDIVESGAPDKEEIKRKCLNCKKNFKCSEEIFNQHLKNCKTFGKFIKYYKNEFECILCNKKHSRIDAIYEHFQTYHGIEYPEETDYPRNKKEEIVKLMKKENKKNSTAIDNPMSKECQKCLKLVSFDNLSQHEKSCQPIPLTQGF